MFTAFRLLLIAVLLGSLAVPMAPAWADVLSKDDLTVEDVSLDKLDRAETSEVARRLSTATLPQEAFESMMRNALLIGFRSGLTESTIADLNVSAPGLVESMEGRMLKAAEPHFSELFRRTTQRYAAIFTVAFAPTELSELVRFFESPVGRKVAVQRIANMTNSKTFEDTLVKQDLAENDVRRIELASSLATLRSLSPEERKAVAAFDATPLAKKLAGMNPLFTKIELLMAKEENPEMENAVQEAVASAVEEYMAN